MTMHVGHIALRVTDPVKAAWYATRVLGLRSTVASATEAMFTSNEKHHELQLIPAADPSLDHIGLEVDSERELEAARDRAIAAGATMMSEFPQEEGIQNAVRLLAPGDLVFEIYSGMQREPMSLANGLRSGLRRFGHAAVLSEDRPKLVAFLIAGLGFRVSDTYGDRLTFLRCDSDHHGVAVAEGKRNWLHHYAFELGGWGALRDFLDSLIPTGVRPIWGPVRHGPGFNMAAYFPDTDGCLVEAYAEMQRIDNDSTYVPIDWSTVENARNLWGSDPPSSFLEKNGIPILEQVRVVR